jgi:S-adenosylmethionine/arginine decarboxylase-like enzyme
MPGRHITLDASVRDPSVFTHDHLRAFFVALCAKLGMEIIHGPVFKDVSLDPAKLASVKSGGAFQDEGGTTGMVVISTSHISIHTWELRRFFQLDVFSCKDFDGEAALQFIYESLGVSRASVCEIVRYDEYTPPTIMQTSTVIR